VNCRDRFRYGRLCVALRHPGLSYPNDALLRHARSEFRGAGLSLRQDVQGSFDCDLVDRALAEQLLASLYLPDVDAARMEAGRQVVRRWAGSSITTPIRLLVGGA
jgi:hypothetical protein